MGETLRSTLLARHLPEVRQEIEALPQELVLIQVPIEVLDQLRVPIDTPAFKTLDLRTQRAIGNVLVLQAKEHLLEVSRREIIQKHKIRALTCHEQLIGRVKGKERFLDEYIKMVKVERKNHPAQCAYFPRYGNPSNIRIALNSEMADVLRVRATFNQEHVVNALSRELATSLKEFSGENVILLPRRMIVDDIFCNRAPSHLPIPFSPQEDVASPRQVTYAIYREFNLINDRRFPVCTINRQRTSS